jgi:hypothetical protein
MSTAEERVTAFLEAFRSSPAYAQKALADPFPAIARQGDHYLTADDVDYLLFQTQIGRLR